MLYSQETASDMLEEGGDDVKSAWPLWAGPHTCYNGNDNGPRSRKAKLIPKNCLSSDCGLQLAHMKPESLVIVNQHVTVNTFPSLVLTARQVRGVGSARSPSMWRPTVSSITRTKS